MFFDFIVLVWKHCKSERLNSINHIVLWKIKLQVLNKKKGEFYVKRILFSKCFKTKTIYHELFLFCMDAFLLLLTDEVP